MSAANTAKIKEQWGRLDIFISFMNCLIAKRITTLGGQVLGTTRIASQSICGCQDINFNSSMPLYVNDRKISIEVPRQEWQDESSLFIKLATIRILSQRFDFKELKMELISVNVGLPREVTWKGKTVGTGIFKEPVSKRVMVRLLNLDGDGQADLTVHGGLDKAVYVYPFEHYAYWRSELPDNDLPLGIFGENFTTTGLREEDVNIGDRFQIGTVRLMVTQPRLPCYKLGIRFGRPDMVKRFLASRRTGFYFRVLQEGEVGAGDTLELESRDDNNITVADITQLYVRAEDNPELLHRAAQLEALPQSWRDYFQR
jgi:MOSC domain-containing protein YiiM